MRKSKEIPFRKSYTLSIEEAALYFRIGENKIRRIINENKSEDFILWNGNQAQIKRGESEKFIDKCSAI